MGTRTFAVFHPGNYRSWIYLYADGICIRDPGRCRFSVFLPVGNLVLKQRPYKTARLFVFWMALLSGSSARFMGRMILPGQRLAVVLTSSYVFWMTLLPSSLAYWPDDSARPTRPLFCCHRNYMNFVY